MSPLQCSDEINTSSTSNGQSESVHEAVPDVEYKNDTLCDHMRSELRFFMNGLNYQRLFGADEYLTTVDRTIVSVNDIRTCHHHNQHHIDCEITFDPFAGSGQFMGYVDGERLIWCDISWADFVRCRE